MGRISTRDYEEGRYSFRRGYLTMQRAGECFRRGQYHHPEGIVEVFESLSVRGERTSLYLTRNGLSISRTWQAAWGDKTIARLAREFMEDIISEA